MIKERQRKRNIDKKNTEMIFTRLQKSTRIKVQEERKEKILQNIFIMEIF
jgi:hypothetical protein